MRSAQPLSLVESGEFAALVRGQTPRVAAVRKDAEGGDVDGVFVMSTSLVDRGRDVIAQDGWRLDNYNKAGRGVLWAHDSSLPPIARFASVGVGAVGGGQALVGRGLEFAELDSYPLSKTVAALVKGGFLKTGSVGFLPVRFAFNAERGGMDFYEQELLEFSIVPVPANPDALARAKASGIGLDNLTTWVESALDSESTRLPRGLLEEVWREVAPPKVTVDLAPVRAELAALCLRVEALERRNETAGAQTPQATQGRAAAPAPLPDIDELADRVAVRMAELLGTDNGESNE